jgi:orotate phosphoribosyltransferase
MIKETILSCLKEGDYTLHSGQKSKYIFDVMRLIRNQEFLEEFYNFVDGDFLVGIEFGGAAYVILNGGNQNIDFAIIRKDGTIYGSPIPKDYVLLDDVVTTENSIRVAMEQIYSKIGHYPDEIKCVVDRRERKNKSLHIESMLEYGEE